jgi:hypothetical protein
VKRLLGAGVVVLAAAAGVLCGLRRPRVDAVPAMPVESQRALPSPDGQSRMVDDPSHGPASPKAGPKRTSRTSTPRFVRSFPRLPEASIFKASQRDDFDFVAGFNNEERHPTWAPAMEGALAKVLNSKKMEELGIPGTKVMSTECRSSGCVVEFEYSKALADTLPLESPGARIKPVGVINTKTEALGAMMLTLRLDHLERDGTVYERHKVLVAYDPSRIDPETILKEGSR